MPLTLPKVQDLDGIARLKPGKRGRRLGPGNGTAERCSTNENRQGADDAALHGCLSCWCRPDRRPERGSDFSTPSLGVDVQLPFPDQFHFGA
jgi:hypothetical protein